MGSDGKGIHEVDVAEELIQALIAADNYLAVLDNIAHSEPGSTQDRLAETLKTLSVKSNGQPTPPGGCACSLLTKTIPPGQTCRMSLFHPHEALAVASGNGRNGAI